MFLFRTWIARKSASKTKVSAILLLKFPQPSFPSQNAVKVLYIIWDAEDYTT